MALVIYPILFVDLLKQSSYKNVLLLSCMHKQMVYFAKKYSKSNRIVLNGVNKLLTTCDKDNIKAVKHVFMNVIKYSYKSLTFEYSRNKNVKIRKWLARNTFCVGMCIGYNTSMERSFVLAGPLN